VRRNKALAAILESAVVTDASGNPVDLAALTSASYDELVDAEDDGPHGMYGEDEYDDEADDDEADDEADGDETDDDSE